MPDTLAAGRGRALGGLATVISLAELLPCANPGIVAVPHSPCGLQERRLCGYAASSLLPFPPREASAPAEPSKRPVLPRPGSIWSVLPNTGNGASCTDNMRNLQLPAVLCPSTRAPRVAWLGHPGTHRHPLRPSLAPSAEPPDAPEYARNAALGRFGIISSLPPLFSHKGLALIPGCAALHSPFQLRQGGHGVPVVVSWPRTTQLPHDLEGPCDPPRGAGQRGCLGTESWGTMEGECGCWCHGHEWNGETGAAPCLNTPHDGSVCSSFPLIN